MQLSLTGFLTPLLLLGGRLRGVKDIMKQSNTAKGYRAVSAHLLQPVVLRRQAEGSKIYGKMGIKVARLGGQNEHQCDPGSHEICM